jgi:hypothetical protein
MVESVFGAAHVKNSVTAFNPMELSVVADKVARKAVPAGGISSNGMNMSPAAMPTEVYGRPHDSTGDDSQMAFMAAADNDSIVQAEVPLASVVPKKANGSGSVVGQLIDHDTISHPRRVTLTVACLLAVAAYMTTFSSYDVFVSQSGRFWAFFVPMLCFGGSISWFARKMRGRFSGRSLGRRIGMVMLGAAGAWVAFIVFLRFFITTVSESPTWMIGILPLLAVNWPKRTAPDRKTRADLKLALSCAATALLLAWVFTADEVATIGMTVGSLFAAQMFSPFCRLPIGTESRNPAITRHRKKKETIKAAAGDHVAAHIISAASQVAAELASANPRKTDDDLQEVVDAEIELEPSPHNQATILILNLVYLLFPVAGGLHRLAVGRVVSGIIWLLTGGLFFVGQIYDAVMIVTGQFRDSEGRIVGPPKKNKPTPVNHLSSLPAESKPLHLGAFALNAIGIAGVFTACAAIMGSIAFTVCSLIEHRIFEDLSKNLGSHSWPEITHQLAVIVAIVLVAVSSVCFMFARRRHNAKHVLRALAGSLLFCGAFILTWFAVDEVSWPTVLANVISGSPAEAIQDSFLKDDFLTFFGVAAVTCLAGASILAWPARKTPTTQSEVQA